MIYSSTITGRQSANKQRTKLNRAQRGHMQFYENPWSSSQTRPNEIAVHLKKLLWGSHQEDNPPKKENIKTVTNRQSWQTA